MDQAIKNGQALLKQTTGNIFPSFMLQVIKSFLIKEQKPEKPLVELILRLSHFFSWKISKIFTLNNKKKTSKRKLAIEELIYHVSLVDLRIDQDNSDSFILLR